MPVRNVILILLPRLKLQISVHVSGVSTDHTSENGMLTNLGDVEVYGDDTDVTFFKFMLTKWGIGMFNDGQRVREITDINIPVSFLLSSQQIESL